MNKIPIVFIHSGKFQYMRYVIERAKQCSDNVVLIADQYQEGLRNRNIDAFLAGSKEFEHHYVNMSSNGAWFELLCFSRWFVLNEWMQQENIPVCFHVDTDTLLYCDPDAEYNNKFHFYDLTLSLGSSAATMFITKERLCGFCNYTINAYKERGELFNTMERIYAEFVRNGSEGGICDMTFWKFYRESLGLDYAEMTAIINGSTYDHVLRVGHGFRMNGNRKDIQYIQGIPYGTIVETGEKVRFNSLHFQGDMDVLIPQFIRMQDESTR